MTTRTPAITVRPLRPTDFVSLMGRTGGVGWWNGAKPSGRLGGDSSGSALVASLLERLLPLERRSAWVCYEDGELRGFIAARQRTGRTVWEVDSLLLADGNMDEVSWPLLESLTEEAGAQGVVKVFLRLSEDSVLLPAARRVGYTPYLRETLFAAVHPPIVDVELPGLEPRKRGDALDLYRLYASMAPVRVRQAEGLTLQEWQDTRDRKASGPRARQWVLRSENSVQAWLAIQKERRTGFIDLLAVPTAPTTDLIRFGLEKLRCQIVLCLVPEYLSLHAAMEDSEFTPVARYVSLLKPLAVRVPQARLVPASA